MYVNWVFPRVFSGDSRREAFLRNELEPVSEHLRTNHLRRTRG